VLFKAAGPCFRKANGSVLFPVDLRPYCTQTAVASGANWVSIDYTDDFEGQHLRRHTYELVGRTLRVRVQALDTADLDYYSNYADVWGGATAGTDSPQILQFTGVLAAPIVAFEDGDEHWFFGTALDLCRSNASHWRLPFYEDVVPTATSIATHFDTRNLYAPLDDGTLAAPLDDTFVVSVSREIEDVLLRSDAGPSPWRGRLTGRTFALLGSDAVSWDEYRTFLDDLWDWGLASMAVHTHAYWSASAPEGPQNAGPDWMPAKAEHGFALLSAAARANGQLFGPYTLFAPVPASSPLYDPALLALDSTLTPTGIMSDTAILPIARDEALSIEDAYGVGLLYTDSQSFYTPSNSAFGNAVDKNSGSALAKTLRQSIADRKHWFEVLRSSVQGPLLGESSNATQMGSCEWLWAGYVDALQRAHNCGASAISIDLPPGDPRLPTNWHVVPEYELRVSRALQANYGNGLYHWFFGPDDGPGIVDPLTQTLVLPFTDQALDRYRAYEITFGRAAFFQSNGPFYGSANMLTLPSMVREAYLTNELQRLYFSLALEEIRYLHQGVLRTFEEVWAASESLAAFDDPRVEIRYDGGLTVSVNHAPEPWTVAGPGGSFVLPEDGFLAWAPGTAFVAFSAIPPGGSARIDYCYAPARYEVFDGRGVVSGYGGISAPDKNLKVVNFARGITLHEGATGQLVVDSELQPVASGLYLAAQAAQVQVGCGINVAVLALRQNGAIEDVTEWVELEVDDPHTALFSQGGILWGEQTGSVIVSASSFEGLTAAPIAVEVVRANGTGL
jgi:hypothetical protein